MTALADLDVVGATNTELVRARSALVEVYRRLTDYATPTCVVRQITPAIEMLETWIASERPHL